MVPNKNLVSNLGLDCAESTHTNEDTYAYMKREKMQFPIFHPPFVIKDEVSDVRFVKWILKEKLKKKLLGLFR